jgi:aminoglycoside 6-adenylyltransferase
MLDQGVREQLMKMLEWYVGVKTQFQRGPGKLGKHLKQRLEPELWAMLEKTYSDAGYDNTWEALDAICRLFRLTARRVAEHMRLDYPLREDESITAHLRHVRSLPKDTTEMYGGTGTPARPTGQITTDRH